MWLIRIIVARTLLTIWLSRIAKKYVANLLSKGIVVSNVLRISDANPKSMSMSMNVAIRK